MGLAAQLAAKTLDASRPRTRATERKSRYEARIDTDGHLAPDYRIERLSWNPGATPWVIVWPALWAIELAIIWSPRGPTRARLNHSHSTSSQFRPIQAGASDTVARS